MAGRILGGTGEAGAQIEGFINNACCDCWNNGCGCDMCFAGCADGLEVINPVMEYISDVIWFFGSPLAFPFIFFFDAGPPTEPPGKLINME